MTVRIHFQNPTCEQYEIEYADATEFENLQICGARKKLAAVYNEAKKREIGVGFQTIPESLFEICDSDFNPLDLDSKVRTNLLHMIK